MQRRAEDGPEDSGLEGWAAGGSSSKQSTDPLLSRRKRPPPEIVKRPTFNRWQTEYDFQYAVYAAPDEVFRPQETDPDAYNPFEKQDGSQVRSSDRRLEESNARIRQLEAQLAEQQRLYEDLRRDVIAGRVGSANGMPPSSNPGSSAQEGASAEVQGDGAGGGGMEETAEEEEEAVWHAEDDEQLPKQRVLFKKKPGRTPAKPPGGKAPAKTPGATPGRRPTPSSAVKGAPPPPSSGAARGPAGVRKSNGRVVQPRTPQQAQQRRQQQQQQQRQQRQQAPAVERRAAARGGAGRRGGAAAGVSGRKSAVVVMTPSARRSEMQAENGEREGACEDKEAEALEDFLPGASVVSGGMGAGGSNGGVAGQRRALDRGCPECGTRYRPDMACATCQERCGISVWTPKRKGAARIGPGVSALACGGRSPPTREWSPLHCTKCHVPVSPDEKDEGVEVVSVRFDAAATANQHRRNPKFYKYLPARETRSIPAAGVAVEASDHVAELMDMYE